MNFKTSRYFQTRGYNCRVTYTDDESTIGKLFQLIDTKERGYITPIDAANTLSLIQNYSKEKIDRENLDN